MKKGLFFIGLLILLSFISVAYAGNVVISEVLYRPIGTENKEWIELYNPTNAAVDIGGWKIYSFFNKSPDFVIPLGKIIQSHGYFLIGDTEWDASWPSPDYSERIWLTNVDAGVKLADKNNIAIDALGWGTSSQVLYGYYEGQAHSLVAAGHSLKRIFMPDCSVKDTTNNAADFIDNAQLSPKNSGYKCVETFCGDNIINGNEVCDGTSLGGKTCQDFGYSNPNTLTCNANCLSFNTAGCHAVCGNNVKEPGEGCDDGNLANGDGCSSQCVVEQQSVFCGDGVVNGTEVCDGSSLNGKTCVDFGYSNPNTLVCNENCLSFNTAGCHAVCGNNVKEPGEGCDDGNLANGDGCSSQCNVEQLPVCGDGILNGVEVCDGSSLNGKTCIDFGYSNPNTLTCDPNCLSFNTAGCHAVCGNGNIEYGENCDDSNLISGDGCSVDCQSEIDDDFRINYIRGRMTIEGIPAPDGTHYKIEVLFGANSGTVYEGVVGGDVPNFLKGDGLFDTRDRVIFTTGSAFRITSNYCEGSYEGQFLNGGNGDFLDEGSIVKFDCFLRSLIHNVYHTPAEPTELDSISMFANVTDNIGVDKVFVYYTVNNASTKSKEMNLNGVYSVSLGIFNKRDTIDYAIMAKDVNGNEVWSDDFLITVKAGDRDGDGYNSDDDCNDNNSLVNPAATESCNGLDDDCDGQIDEEDADGCTIYNKDFDIDGYGSDDTKCLCSAVYPYNVTNIDDCNDNDNLVNPATTESCNGLDDDCDNVIDEEDATGCSIFNKDFDIDGYGINETKCLCSAAYPYNVTNIDDCNDNDNLVNPAGTEICNGLDDDCDGTIDEEDALGCGVYYKDEDNDKYGTIPDSIEDTLYEGETKKYTLNGRDYNVTVTAITDTGTIYAKFNINGESTPSLKEGDSATLSDGAAIIVRDIIPNEAGDVTQDLITLQDLVTFELSISDNKCLCSAQDPYDTNQSNDCNDINASINPLANEICNGVDDDCDGTTDEEDATGCTPFNKDFDIDGYGSNETKCLCSAYYPYNVTQNNDCDDNNSLINPTVTEICNGLDDDCDNAIDEGFIDTDNDGIVDCVDVDDDNDGINDTEDDYPLDPDRHILGDVSGDDKVDITDLMMVRAEFGKTPSDPDWKPYYDVNGDGKISLADLIKIRRSFT